MTPPSGGSPGAFVIEDAAELEQHDQMTEATNNTAKKNTLEHDDSDFGDFTAGGTLGELTQASSMTGSAVPAGAHSQRATNHQDLEHMQEQGHRSGGYRADEYDSDHEGANSAHDPSRRPGTAADHQETLLSDQPKRDALDPNDPSFDPDAKPTIVFAIPFPEAPMGIKGDVPPFCVYTPPAAKLKKPEEGKKEGLMTTVQRKWQEQQAEAKSGPPNFRNKAMGYVSSAISWTRNSRVEFLTRTPGKSKLSELRILYPPSMPAEDLQSKFTTLLKAVRAAAIRNGVISTAILPLVFVFDTLTFIRQYFYLIALMKDTAVLISLLAAGPFEVNTAWAVASWTGAARASSITNSLTNESVPISFHSSPLLDSLAFRLAELCKAKAKPETPTAAPVWHGKEPPMNGIELAAVTLAAVTTHVGLEAHEIFENDLETLLEDIEEVLNKGASEWLSIVEKG